MTDWGLLFDAKQYGSCQITFRVVCPEADVAMFQKMMFSVTLRMKTKTGCIRNERCSLFFTLLYMYRF